MIFNLSFVIWILLVWLCVCERFFVAFFSCFGPCCCYCFFDFSFRHRTKNRYHTKFVYLSRSSLLISSMLSVYLFMFLLHVFFSVHCLGQHMITEISFSPPPPYLSLALFSVRSLFHKIIWDIQQAFVNLPTPSSCIPNTRWAELTSDQLWHLYFTLGWVALFSSYVGILTLCIGFVFIIAAAAVAANAVAAAAVGGADDEVKWIYNNKNNNKKTLKWNFKNKIKK